MAIFMSLSRWGKDPLDSFSIKTNKILYDLSPYHIKHTDSKLPCVCSVITGLETVSSCFVYKYKHALTVQ